MLSDNSEVVGMDDINQFEIERKFLIRMPDTAFLLSQGEMSHIVQTYLKTEDGSERVRKRGREGGYTYTHTVKKRLSDLRRIEQERVISEGEYLSLLRLADPDMSTIYKDRYCIDYMGQILEIDIFPFYSDRAFLEIELSDESQQIFIPPWIDVIKEVTEDKRYTNAALARNIPYDPI